jgi:hypothetical protein
MNSSYLWLKTLHVVAASLWIGSAASLWVATLRMQKTTDRQLLLGMAMACEMIGSRITAAFSGLTLVLGIIDMIIGKVPMTLWIWFGLIAGVLLVAVGGGVLKRRLDLLAKVAADPATPQSQIDGIIRTIINVGRFALILLVLAVVAMVIKPV